MHWTTDLSHWLVHGCTTANGTLHARMGLGTLLIQAQAWISSAALLVQACAQASRPLCPDVRVLDSSHDACSKAVRSQGCALLHERLTEHAAIPQHPSAAACLAAWSLSEPHRALTACQCSELYLVQADAALTRGCTHAAWRVQRHPALCRLLALALLHTAGCGHNAQGMFGIGSRLIGSEPALQLTFPTALRCIVTCSLACAVCSNTSQSSSTKVVATKPIAGGTHSRPVRTCATL